MKTKITRFIALLAGVATLSMTPAVNAIVLTVGDAYYLGQIDDGIPSGVADEVTYISDLITLTAGQGTIGIGTEIYDRINSTVLGLFPTPTVVGTDKGVNGIDATGFQYVLAKYGSSGSWVWFVGGLANVGNVTVPSDWPGRGGGLSHVSLYNGNGNVPDGGLTVLMLGAAIAGLGALRRKF